MSTSRSLRRVVWTLVWIGLVILVFSVSRVNSQSKPPKTAGAPQYDFATETKIKGIVEEIKPPTSDSKTALVGLRINEDAALVELSLCPKSFLDDLGVSFSKGDKLEITGSKVKRGDLEEVLVREVVRGNDTLVFRDKSGKPVW